MVEIFYSFLTTQAEIGIREPSKVISDLRPDRVGQQSRAARQETHSVSKVANLVVLVATIF